jgi:uncharacterized protein YajQ (UPF0234 family)
VQECKEPKVEMYKSIWDLMFKCNDSRIQFKSIQFSQEYNNQGNLSYPHTAQIIYQSIINVLHEYNLKRDLENKIFSISFDNSSNNIKSIDYFTRALNSIMDG